VEELGTQGGLKLTEPVEVTFSCKCVSTSSTYLLPGVGEILRDLACHVFCVNKGGKEHDHPALRAPLLRRGIKKPDQMAGLVKNVKVFYIEITESSASNTSTPVLDPAFSLN
jgi:hypothetical protein